MASSPSTWSFRSPSVRSARDAVAPARLLAVAAGLVLIGSYVSVFYHVVDVVGGVQGFVTIVVAAFLLGAAFAAVGSTRAGIALATVLLAAGSSAYLLFVPSLQASVFSVEFVVENLEYLTGVSVIKFKRADLWAVGVVPSPVFLSWYLTLRRRYDLAALVGGVTLGVFALTGDADPTTTLVGTTALLGMLGFGALERVEAPWSQLEQFGLVLLIAVVATRLIDVAPAGVAAAADGSGVGGGGGGSGGGSGDTATESELEGSLLDASEEIEILGSISLSPTVRFTVTADAPAYWHVDAYDRYTGTGWVRTGDAVAYDGELSPPPGPTQRLEQSYRIETAVETMPAAWKPVRLSGEAAAGATVTDRGGLQPGGRLDAGQSYEVASERPTWTAESLGAAGTDYPSAVTDRYLQLPASTPARLRRRAREIAGDAGTPYETALRIERWIKRNKRYSLEVDRPEGNVADAFVFEMDAGYCVYTATAMTVLLRTLGVPSRVAVGYTTGERVDENRWVVRGLDSHSWVEVYFPEIGWVPFDPTPSGPRERAERDRLAAARADGTRNVDTGETGPNAQTPTEQDFSFTAGAENATQTPPRPVAGSDNETDAGGAFTGTPDDGTEGDEAGVGRLLTSDRDRLTAAAAVAALLVGAHRVGLAERAYRSIWLRWQPSTDSPQADVEGAFDRLEYVLERRYRERHPDETPRRYLAALGETAGIEDPRLDRLVALHEHARYGNGVSRAEADEAIRLVAEVVEGGVAAEGTNGGGASASDDHEAEETGSHHTSDG